jgi:sugar phosphate isomerase/epimerase
MGWLGVAGHPPRYCFWGKQTGRTAVFKNLNVFVLGLVGHQSDVIEQALTYGFQAMDLDVVDLTARARLRGMAYARRLIDSSRIRIGSFRLPFDVGSEMNVFKEHLVLLAEWASAAAEVGCRRCVTTIEPAGDRLPYHENFSFHQDRLAEVAGVLQPCGIRLGIALRAAADLRRQKAFQFIHEPDALVLLAKMSGPSSVGVVLDAWNWFVAGYSLESLRAVPVEQIVAVELAGAPDGVALEDLTEQSRLLPTVGGRFDIPAVLAALAEMGYEGPVSVTPHSSTMCLGRGDSMAKAMAQSLDKVWQAAGLSPKGKLAASIPAA